jgi:hypothetical protein
VSFDGETNAARHGLGVHAALHQIILRPLAGRSKRHLFVIKASDDDHRKVRRLGAQLGERLKAFAVGQREVQQDDIHITLGELFQPAREPVSPPQVYRGACRLEEHLPKQSRVGRIVFDQQDPGWSVIHLIHSLEASRRPARIR